MVVANKIVWLTYISSNIWPILNVKISQYDFSTMQYTPFLLSWMEDLAEDESTLQTGFSTLEECNTKSRLLVTQVLNVVLHCIYFVVRKWWVRNSCWGVRLQQPKESRNDLSFVWKYQQLITNICRSNSKNMNYVIFEEEKGKKAPLYILKFLFKLEPLILC